MRVGMVSVLFPFVFSEGNLLAHSKHSVYMLNSEQINGILK